MFMTSLLQPDNPFSLSLCKASKRCIHKTSGSTRLVQISSTETHWYHLTDRPWYIKAMENESKLNFIVPSHMFQRIDRTLSCIHVLLHTTLLLKTLTLHNIIYKKRILKHFVYHDSPTH